MCVYTLLLHRWKITTWCTLAVYLFLERRARAPGSGERKRSAAGGAVKTQPPMNFSFPVKK
jgi:hypothetical protein